MQFVIVTGMSGAGKSTVLRFLEDIDFFCVDNLPPALISKFAEICFKPGNDIDKIALGIDIRGGVLFHDLFECLSGALGYQYEILFLEASDDVLVKRFKETRRSHPLSKNDRIEKGIAKERLLLSDVKLKADYIIDTSFCLTRHLKEQINSIFLLDADFESLVITILSFGFKYGIPSDSDLVFDVRFIPNPFYIDGLKNKTGEDKSVNDFVMSCNESIVFLNKLSELIEFLIPNYIKEGKNQLVISIGCTGGKHRSVTLANNLYSSLLRNNHNVIISHRDILVSN